MGHEHGQLAHGAVVAGRYRIEGTLGQGGMAVVYRARHLGTDKECALKLLLPELADDAKLRELFVQEARVSGRIGACPYIVDVFDTGIEGSTSTPFIAMELLHGATLSKRLRHRSVPRDDVEPILLQLGKGLEAAHRAGVVHRDLKPGNIFLTEDDEGRPRVKILDFGIAKVLEGPGGRTATQAGSPWYSAPEQLGAGMRKLAAKQGYDIAVGVSPATDVWALALCACELVLGLRASRYWGSDTSADLMIRVALEPRRPPSDRVSVGSRVVPGFDSWFLRCTAHDATARYPSALEAVEALVALLKRADQKLDQDATLRIAPVARRPASPESQPEGVERLVGGPERSAHASQQPAASRERPTVRMNRGQPQAATLEPSPSEPLESESVPRSTSRIVRQGTSQALAGPGAVAALAAAEQLRAGVATPAPTGPAPTGPTPTGPTPTGPTPTGAAGATHPFDTVPPAGGSTSGDTNPSALRLSDAAVGPGGALSGADTASSWQHSKVRPERRRKVALLLAAGAAAGLLALLLVAWVVGRGSPATASADDGGPRGELVATATPSGPDGSSESGAPPRSSAQRARLGVDEHDVEQAASRVGATEPSSVAEADSGVTDPPAELPSGNAAAARPAAPATAVPPVPPRRRPEGKESVFEDF